MGKKMLNNRSNISKKPIELIIHKLIFSISQVVIFGDPEEKCTTDPYP